jgi:soluble lytic murein transglycosylase-like protein
MLLYLPGTAVRADVMEIGENGAVRVRASGGAVQWVDPGMVDRDATAGAPAADIIPAAAITTVEAAPIPDSWRAAVETAASRYTISPHLLAALVWQESRWHAGAVSPKGAVGLAQLMPGTARALAVDARDPAANLDGGARYLRHLLDMFDGDIERSLAAYNAGPARVIRSGGVPRIAETRAYVANIIDRMTPVAHTGLTK